jgi:hypothetical protein
MTVRVKRARRRVFRAIAALRCGIFARSPSKIVLAERVRAPQQWRACVARSSPSHAELG